MTRRRSRVTLTDFGHPFEPYDPGLPDPQTLLEDRAPGGFGLHFIHQTMDDVAHRTDEEGNHLTLVKRLPPGLNARTSVQHFQRRSSAAMSSVCGSSPENLRTSSRSEDSTAPPSPPCPAARQVRRRRSPHWT